MYTPDCKNNNQALYPTQTPDKNYAYGTAATPQIGGAPQTGLTGGLSPQDPLETSLFSLLDAPQTGLIGGLAPQEPLGASPFTLPAEPPLLENGNIGGSDLIIALLQLLFQFLLGGNLLGNTGNETEELSPLTGGILLGSGAAPPLEENVFEVPLVGKTEPVGMAPAAATTEHNHAEHNHAAPPADHVHYPGMVM